MSKKCNLFKALSNETRLKIFKMLAKERLCVSKIVERLEVSQPTVSQHLKILENCGLVKSEKIKYWMHYSANVTGIKKCKKELEELIDIMANVKEDSSGNCHKRQCNED
ncbi:MAG: ArsR/SmtB family transcription factor [Elusimicrobiota bacterium]